jgi:hypothetical protein
LAMVHASAANSSGRRGRFRIGLLQSAAHEGSMGPPPSASAPELQARVSSRASVAAVVTPYTR